MSDHAFPMCEHCGELIKIHSTQEIEEHSIYFAGNGGITSGINRLFQIKYYCICKDYDDGFSNEENLSSITISPENYKEIVEFYDKNRYRIKTLKPNILMEFLK